MMGYVKRHYKSETAIRDAQKHYRGQSYRGRKDDTRSQAKWVLWVKEGAKP